MVTHVVHCISTQNYEHKRAQKLAPTPHTLTRCSLSFWRNTKAHCTGNPRVCVFLEGIHFCNSHNGTELSETFVERLLFL